MKHKSLKVSVNRSKSWDCLDDSPRKNLTFGTRVPAALLAAISERLGPDVHPEDTIVVEMSAENIASKMRHAFTVQELQEIVSRYEEQLSRIYTKAASVSVEHLANQRLRLGRNEVSDWLDAQRLLPWCECGIRTKVKPIPLESILDPDDDGPITFEIRHGKERNVFKLPAGKLKGNKKWQVTFTIRKTQKDLNSLPAK
ncbi:uncharacterized protein TNIN_478351 [Trichonephila inaurata madagascariensis]|uniref:Uncharacterized protein n=1 Tax=Trichonephila inaurata madagascariensis TaxID=2747483 RepID=A0A8X6XEA8_9ARAC|nr:uncharacterized protein TNIN_478351 [Trichonephila inaurata madagascariensis]